MLRSLKFKTIMIMILLIVIPLGTLTVVALNSFKTATLESVESKLDDLLDLTGKAITDEVEKAGMLAKILSAEHEIINYVSGNTSARTDVYEYLAAQQAANPELIEMLIVTDANGMSMTAHSAEILEIDVSDRDYVKTALSGEMGISDAIISRATEMPIIAIGYPIYKDDEIVGTIIVTVHFSNITKKIRDIKVFDEGYAYLFNKEGLTLSHPVAENEFELNLAEIDIQETADMVTDIKAGKSGSKHYTFTGVYKYVKYIEVNDWGLAITANYDDYMSTNNQVRNLALIVLVVAAVIAIIIAYLYSEVGIIRPLKKLKTVMGIAGEGNLTVSVDIRTKDEFQEIGESFNNMIDQQEMVVSKVKKDAIEIDQSAEDIAHSTGEFSSSSEMITQSILTVSENSENQNEAVVDTSEVLLQLSSLIQLARQRALTADKSVQTSLVVAEKGRINVQKTIHAIREINDSSTNTENILKELESLSVQVKGIIDTINGIAGQTNMLALNASIEAARAGEHGQGFAVVAQEVGKLAEQTTNEANGISIVVNDMVDNINQAVESMLSGREAVENGVVQSNDTDKAFIVVLEAVNQISKDITEIVSVTDEEVASSDRILQLIDNVATLSEGNSKKSQEVAAATEEQTAIAETIAAGSQELTAMANELAVLVERFKVRGEHNE